MQILVKRERERESRCQVAIFYIHIGSDDIRASSHANLYDLRVIYSYTNHQCKVNKTLKLAFHMSNLDFYCNHWNRSFAPIIWGRYKSAPRPFSTKLPLLLHSSVISLIAISTMTQTIPWHYNIWYKLCYKRQHLICAFTY